MKSTNHPIFVLVSGVMVGHYLQRVTERLDLGAELVYQYDSKVPGGEMAAYTLAGRYSGKFLAFNRFI